MAGLPDIRLTSPDKVLYPRQGITKRELADYLARMAERLTPHVAGRPLSLVRCPEGRARACFFQRHQTPGLPREIKGVRIPGKDRKPYLYVDSVAGLVSTAQIGTLELHLWGSRVEDLEHPDRLVFDLDPDPSVAFAEVKAAARLLKRILDSAELESFVMLTGGKGLHVIVPLCGGSGWEAVKGFAHGIAAAVAADQPERFTAKAAKHRRSNRIFIDWMRNLRGGTAIAPYSTRAREGCPIAVPVTWSELSRIARPDQYTIRTIDRRLKALGADPWARFFRVEQDLPEGALDLFR